MNLKNLDKNTLIMKFGGSCLAHPEDFKQIKQILAGYLHKEDNITTIIVVVSAITGVTDKLIELTRLASKGSDHQVISGLKEIERIHENFIDVLFDKNLKGTNSAKGQLQKMLNQLATVLEEVAEFGIIPYFIDYVMSFGEKLCATLVHLYLSQENFSSRLFFGEDLIITNSEYNKAVPDLEHTRQRIAQKVVHLIDNNWNHQILVVTGFIGRNEIGYTTTLGRGGSDFTATVLARMLFDLKKFSGGRVILWKDVPGILSGNPAHIKDPQLIHRLSYTEAKEIAVLGAKILHPKCISIIEHQNIPIEIRTFKQPDSSEFTLISVKTDEIPIKGIEIEQDCLLICLESPLLLREQKFIGEIFSYCAESRLDVSLIQQSYSQNRLLLTSKDPDASVKLERFRDQINIPKEWLSITSQMVGIITIIADPNNQTEIITKLGEILFSKAAHPKGILQDYLGISVSVVIPGEYLTEIANEINLSFFENIKENIEKEAAT